MEMDGGNPGLFSNAATTNPSFVACKTSTGQQSHAGKTPAAFR
jgi:hypothetical protein